MKHYVLSLAFLACLFSVSLSSRASSYKADEAAVDELFNASEDVTLVAADLVANATVNSNTAGGGKTVGGFLIRNFFCGGIALHRHYMGGDWGKLWWKYFCIPVAGGVASCGDFLYVLIKGNEALDKYDGEDKFFVWM